MRIKPDKHFDIETSIISLGSVIIEKLLINISIEFKKLFFILQETYKDVTVDEFVYVLTFLYSLGIVEYSKETDSIDLIRNDQGYSSIEIILPWFEFYLNMIKVGDANAN
ncbi:hypothetical protein LGL55_20495 [Clostridium tagluense]|uniref:ABC-three component system middle component 6 n=1 Tax=Clostridium tagluense TaxID=360422 RepID=UPI001CF22348|nr:ABC-three component system middle component 6 [Clostridium tagluense]MCB2313462.1 hypothetical protein [Clostridium tagluense]MCB2318271.1 hypothetical protein [Clostridium tagluense]MCB2323073.1 hypothetical protein [Clostridium tagluense]MCB2328055.1 hypothetical protein [Clostridium tagluense]MCB2332789.1 hypothetical protein [Clostridium tagluense]